MAAPKGRKADPQNVRAYLNYAAEVANDIVKTIGPKTKSGALLDREERANLELAVNTLKTVRELYLRTQALQKNQAQVSQVINYASIPSDQQSELRVLASKLLISQAENKTGDLVKDIPVKFLVPE